MAWDFSTEPEFQAKLDWMDGFVRDEVEPLDLLWGGRTFHPLDDELREPSSTRSSSRCGTRACGPATWAPSSGARATAR